MKYLGLLCMAAAAVAGGFLLAGEWEMRVKMLGIFRQMAVCLKARILYSNETLPEALKEVEAYAQDTAVLGRLGEIKRANKLDFAAYVKKTQGVVLNTDAIFDVQVKRLHEYKRHHRNTCHSRSSQCQQGKKRTIIQCQQRHCRSICFISICLYK